MNNSLKQTYRNKKVLVTGHTGFKGSWLSLWLNHLGADVVGYSLAPPTKPNLFESISLENQITHFIGDVRDENRLLSVCQECKPEFVFHLAAQPLVRFSYEEPKLTYETNIMGTVNVLEAVRRTESVRVCVIITSDKCYENRECLRGYRETDPMGGFDPYSSSKGCAELVVASYRKSFFNPAKYGELHNVALSSARAGNVIGGGDWGTDRLVPDCVKKLSQNEKIIIRSPSAVRPWQYVLEPLMGYLMLGAHMYENGVKYSDAWNFGPNDENVVTVEEVVKLVLKQWGSGTYVTETSRNRLHEANLLKLDISKSRTSLGWRPIYNIQETIKRTINWYKNYYDAISSKDLRKLSVDEIREYMQSSETSRESKKTLAVEQ